MSINQYLVTLLLFCVALGSSSKVNANPGGSDAATDEDRLLLAVRSPSIVNATLTSLTVGFNSGPNLKDVDFSVSCIKPSDPFDCTNPALNSASPPVTGVSPKRPSSIEVQVIGLEFNTTYDCYISATVGRVTRCFGPATGSTLAPQWVLGQLGGSCDQVCSQTGRICNQEPQRDIVTLDQYSFVANLLDVQVFSNTYNCGGLSCSFPEIPGFQSGLNGINSGISNCAGSRGGVRRFCCCGPSELCPVS